MILILGDISFPDDETAIVEKVHEVRVCNDEDSACELGEEQLDFFESYLVPDVYRGKITYVHQSDYDFVISFY